MIKYLTRYHPHYITALLYMLQASEYKPKDYSAWYLRTKDFSTVARRRSLVMTTKAKLLLILLWGLVLIQVMCFAIMLWIWFASDEVGWLIMAGIVTLVGPFVTAYVVLFPLWLGQIVIQRPKQRRLIAAAHQKLAAHKGLRIAVAGSFGKTTFKEVLATILSEGKMVAVTPGNMNTPIGISRFINTLTGKEEILLFELGESHVGDVKELCELVQPNMGIITGINEAHLITFKTIERTTSTIFELADFLPHGPVYKNAESELVRKRAHKNDRLLYSRRGVNGWAISDSTVSINGTHFTATKGQKIIWAESGLLGQHQIGPLVACIDIADTLGLSVSQIADGLKKTKPFEHRMQPRQLHGAWIIDDTYNGNKEGVKVGIDLLCRLEARRRIYVTPGLVGQGEKTQTIHTEIGKQLAAASIDVIVLMRNSVTAYIVEGLRQAGFQNELLLIDEPLQFYTNLEHFVAAGDVILLQNDWTDNYA